MNGSIQLTFKKSNGELIETVQANEGDDIVDVSWEYDLDIEDLYDKLEEPSDDENECACLPARFHFEDRLADLWSFGWNSMLDLAFGLTDTSRLGCQVKVTKEMNGTTITLPSATRNLRVDGSKPTPH
ncbi:hypothetical protein P7C70_g8765, partial [Phenoliferia sp. Uapishka_3]